MRVLIATGLYPPESGGPATYAKLLEEKLPALSVQAGQSFAVTVLPFRVVRHLPKLVKHLAYFFKCLSMARHADVVYALDTVSVGFPAVLAAMAARKKFVVRVPGDYAWEQARQRFGVTDELDAFQTQRYGFKTELLSRIQRFVVRRAARVVVPSDYMNRIVSRWLEPTESYSLRVRKFSAKNLLSPRVSRAAEPLREHDSVGSSKVITIYSSIELPPPTVAPQNRPEGFLVVSSGRRVPWKGFEALARVVAREKDWRLFIAENLPRAQALGWVRVANVFVLNSTYEGLSHLLIEAMSIGTPIVATCVGGNPELILDGVDGILIPPGDDEALHAALKTVEREPHAARARAESARAKTKLFSIDETIGKLTSLLTSL